MAMQGCARTKGELEAEISRMVVRLKRELTGRGPLEIRSYLLDDLVVVRLRGVLTPAEHALLSTGGTGRQLVKQMRQELVNSARPDLERTLERLLGVGLRSLQADFGFEEDACVLVICLTARPELPALAPPSGATTAAKARKFARKSVDTVASTL